MNEKNRTSSQSQQTHYVRERKAPAGSVLAAQNPLLLMLVAFGLIFLMIMGLRGCAAKQDAEPGSTPMTENTADTQSRPSETEPTPVATQPDSHGQAPDSDAVTTEAATTEPPTTEPPGPVMMTVDDSYFADALFLGDSRTDGLYLYSTPGDCKHYPYPATSMTIFGIMDSKDENNLYGCANLRALLQKEQFGKIYLMFGINEAGYNTDTWAKQYKSVVEEIRSYQPNAIIYIQSILYVTQKHEQKNPVFATAKLKEKNERLKELANDVDIFYLEVNDCLNDGTDHLPSDYTGDGAHLKAKYYRLWHDYLLQHAVVDEAHPWTPPATEPEPSSSEGEKTP